MDLKDLQKLCGAGNVRIAVNKQLAAWVGLIGRNVVYAHSLQHLCKATLSDVITHRNSTGQLAHQFCTNSGKCIFTA